MSKADNRRLWVEALRSGRYNQVAVVLGNEKGFCCLGVACEVAIANGVDIPKGVSDLGCYTYGKEQVTGCLPSEVQDWLGLATSDGMLRLGSLTPCDSLATLNDEARWNFDQIANVIARGDVRLEAEVNFV